MPHSILDRLLFSLGEYYKEEVKNLAAEKSFGFIAERKESMGICFSEKHNYRDYLKAAGIMPKPGNFIDTGGIVLGRHTGITQYTVGQRRGLNLQANKPLFVNEIKPETNEIVLSDYNALFRSRIWLGETHFVNKNLIFPAAEFKVKIRYRMRENRCRVNLLSGRKAVLELMEPVAMAANGQTTVLYDGERVIGGGFIERSE